MNRHTLPDLARRPWLIVIAGMLFAALLYTPGLTGGWLFDDYPNIVDNRGVQPADHDMASLVRAALSSPSSDFKRPLASLSFALNYLVSGLNPPAMKATNLAIHLVNGLLAFLLLRVVIRTARRREDASADRLAAMVAGGWMLLSINLTSVLYVVQRMESLANAFVLGGLLAYVHGRRRMLEGRPGIVLCIAGVILGTGIGALAKETAVMLPLYALFAEVILFRWQRIGPEGARKDRRLIAFFLIVLALPLCVGGAWLAPTLLDPRTWATRTFTLSTRLLSEGRIVVDYIVWTLFPTPEGLSFYHDDFAISTGLFTPWTTAASIAVLAGLAVFAVAVRARMPLVALGIAWYLGCHLLTGTVLPLELVYEHRNYFASLGVLLAAFDGVPRILTRLHVRRFVLVAIAALFFVWQGGLTLLTAQSWGDPLALAREFAYRGPSSPRAQYELGRTYIIYSRYDPASPYPALATTALEKAAALPGSSILPEQALIFMNSRMHRPIDPAWWKSMVAKLRARPPAVQDESALDALAACLRDKACDFPAQDLLDAYLASLEHPRPSARLLGMYANFAWSSLNDRRLALRVQGNAIAAAPREAAYRIGFVRMATLSGDFNGAREQLGKLRMMNIGGELDHDIDNLDSGLRDAERSAVDNPLRSE
ncbi:hypothetical protein [Luteibacter sp. 3190]|uniref:hypothetical protein n=1 Tax=Luteibacter sp. 3190 TaxID=2817736 RepID=UPI0028604BF6|nr:hypothetical protein [Luteibacter sp. 3190]MDR6934883.1 hypothetical protein [Luteibacter sp. 3190]